MSQLVSAGPAFALPPEDLATFGALPPPVKEAFWQWVEALTPILRDRRRIMERIGALAAQTGESVPTWRRRFDAIRKGDWRRAINKRSAGPAWWNLKSAHGRGLSPADKNLMRRYAENFQRDDSGAEAWRRLGADLRKGTVRAEAPADPRTGLPRGFSLATFTRVTRADKYSLTAARIGSNAAAAHGPFVFTTRQGLWVGSHLAIDDKDHDYFVNSFANKQAGRPMELGLLDVFSAYKPFWVLAISHERPDGTKSGKPEILTRHLLAGHFYYHGYSPRGTEILAELGTAKVDERIRAILHRYSDGKITVRENAMKGGAAHIGQVGGLRKGNFRHKAALESRHRSEHIVLSDLPGQTGRNVANRPEQLDGRRGLLAKNEELLALRQKLLAIGRADLADAIEYDLVEHTQLLDIIRARYDLIHQDREHRLEGWVESGLVRQQLRIGDTWVDQAALFQAPDEQREAVRALIGSGQVETRPVRASREEVWQAGRGALLQLPGAAVCEILGPDLARERRVNDGIFAFEDQDVGPGLYRFDCVIRDAFGRRVQLQEGQTYQTFINPFRPDVLFVCDAKLRYLGTAAEWDKVRRYDSDGLERALKRASKALAEKRADLDERHAPEAEARLARMRNNADLADQAAGGPERRRAEARDRDLAAKAESALEARHYHPADAADA